MNRSIIGVVLEELRLCLEPDKRMMDKYLPKLLYKSQYAERLPIGNKEVIENFKPDWYRPDLIAIVVVQEAVPKVWTASGFCVVFLPLLFRIRNYIKVRELK